MEAITIKKLHAQLGKEIKKGHGDYVVFVTDDEEANGYHALWYDGQVVSDMGDDERKFVENTNHDISVLKDKDKAYYVG